MTAPDPINAVRLALLGQSSITSLLLPQTALPGLATAPIFGYEYPAKTAQQTHDYAALLAAKLIRLVVISPAGRRRMAGDRGYAPIGSVRFDVLSYGRSKSDAAVAHWAIYEYLKELDRASVTMTAGIALIHSVVVEAGPIAFTDQDTMTPVVAGTYAAAVAEEFVA